MTYEAKFVIGLGIIFLITFAAVVCWCFYASPVSKLEKAARATLKAGGTMTMPTTEPPK
jgi:hypothetical protein